jgi:hypothetical protein
VPAREGARIDPVGLRRDRGEFRMTASLAGLATARSAGRRRLFEHANAQLDCERMIEEVDAFVTAQGAVPSHPARSVRLQGVEPRPASVVG